MIENLTAGYLETLTRSAADLWRSTDGADPYNVLSEVQKQALNRAVRLRRLDDGDFGDPAEESAAVSAEADLADATAMEAASLHEPDSEVVIIEVTRSELALLEANAAAEHPGFDALAAKIKASRAGRAPQWHEYLIYGGGNDEDDEDDGDDGDDELPTPDGGREPDFGRHPADRVADAKRTLFDRLLASVPLPARTAAEVWLEDLLYLAEDSLDRHGREEIVREALGEPAPEPRSERDYEVAGWVRTVTASSPEEAVAWAIREIHREVDDRYYVPDPNPSCEVRPAGRRGEWKFVYVHDTPELQDDEDEEN